MSTRTIEKAIDVDAPRERVWDVLLDDATYRQWTAEFMAGSYADRTVRAPVARRGRDKRASPRLVASPYAASVPDRVAVRPWGRPGPLSCTTKGSSRVQAAGLSPT